MDCNFFLDVADFVFCLADAAFFSGAVFGATFLLRADDETGTRFSRTRRF